MAQPNRTKTALLGFLSTAKGREVLVEWLQEPTAEELDANLVGIPREPFGFSRNARGSFGPPSFKDLSFEMGADDLALEIEPQELAGSGAGGRCGGGQRLEHQRSVASSNRTDRWPRSCRSRSPSPPTFTTSS